MKVLVIYAHPNEKSLNAKIKDIVLDQLKDHDTELIDLYKEKFDPVLPLEELYTIGNKDKSKQVIDYQEKIKKADYLIFISPVWWYDIPAILKGFIDRVFTPHFAFKFTKRGFPVALLQNRGAILIQTYAGPFFAAWLFPNASWRNFKRSILKFCGVKKVKHIPIYKANGVSGENEKAKLKKVYQIEKYLK